MSGAWHEIIIPDGDKAMKITCFDNPRYRTVPMDYIPSYCPVCDAELREKDLGKPEAEGEAPDPEVVDVPLTVNSKGRLVTTDSIKVDGEPVVSKHLWAMHCQTQCGPPVTFVKFLWPDRDKALSWPPLHSYWVWANPNGGQWAYYHQEGYEPVHAEAARFHVKR